MSRRDLHNFCAEEGVLPINTSRNFFARDRIDHRHEDLDQSFNYPEQYRINRSKDNFDNYPESNEINLREIDLGSTLLKKTLAELQLSRSKEDMKTALKSTK